MKMTFSWLAWGQRQILALGYGAIVMWATSAANAQTATTTIRTVAATKAATATTAAPVVCRECNAALPQGVQCRECAAKTAAKMMVEPDMRNGSFLYTLDNDEKSNGIAVYRRSTDGTLRPLSGSPFAAGGRGLSGGDIDEQGAIRVTGSFVLAVNPGSDSVAVLRKSNAGLLHVEGSPFSSGGSTPLSLAVHGDLVYVANQAAAFANPNSEPSLTGFRLSSAGQLIPVPGSRVKFPKGAGPAQVEFGPNGQTLVVTAGFQVDEGKGSRLYSFKVMPDGRLEMGAGSPVQPEGATGTVGFSISPRGDRVYASAFMGSAVVPFSLDLATAAIKQLGEPVGDDQRAACWTAITRDGKTLYVGNFVSNSISVFDILDDGRLTLLGSVPRRGATNKDTKDIELSPDGKYLYAIGSGARQISVFRVEANRLLTELPMGQSPLTITTGQNTTGLVID